MRRTWKMAMGVAVAAVCLGTTCPMGTPGVPTGSGFPKTTEWMRRAINGDAGVRPSVVATGDFDGDSRPDVVVGYQGFDTVGPEIVILFQDSLTSFVPVTLSDAAELAGVAALAVGDVDGDGRLDVIAACSARLVYLRNPTNPRTDAWTVTEVANSSGDGIGQWNDVAIGNIDGTNGLDIVACNGNIGRLSWFRSPSASPMNGTGWTRVDIDATTRAGAASVALQDINGDGRVDVYSTAPSETEARIAWYENPLNPQTNPWTKRTIGNLTAATRLVAADLNADGRTDVIVTNPPGRQVGWYMRPVDVIGATSWSGFLLAQYNIAMPTSIRTADVDGNSQIDVVVATESPGTLRWFTPVGAQTQQWVENNLNTPAEDVARIVLQDFDADGRPDVVAPLRGANTAQDAVAWFENPEP